MRIVVKRWPGIGLGGVDVVENGERDAAERLKQGECSCHSSRFQRLTFFPSRQPRGHHFISPLSYHHLPWSHFYSLKDTRHASRRIKASLLWT